MQSPVVLNDRGRKFLAHYAAILRTLRHQIYHALPAVDPGMLRPFMDAYRAEQTQKPYLLRNHAFIEAIAHCQKVAVPVLSRVDPFLSSSHDDNKLIEASVIADATPRGLAAFAQQSRFHEALIKSLLADPDLIKQMQMADGPRHGHYGLAMQIYTAIEHSCPQSHKGILQRFALAVALVQKPALAWYPFHPVQRYLNFQRAYLRHELNPAFPTFTTWECRFVADEPYRNHEISWFRRMLMNYEPNYVMSGHYLDIVHTDVGYNHMHWNCVPGCKPAQLIAGGGECGARAWIGRLAERAFGIPTWGVKQRGHAALTHWTPTGWVTRLGAGWDWIWWNHRNGLHFLLESKARAYRKKFTRVLRAQWIGIALGEQKPNLSSFGTGGYWWAIAESEEREIIASGKPTYVTPGNARLARVNGPTLAQRVAATEVPSSAVKISRQTNGVITIPAAAYRGRNGTVPGVTSAKSFSGGMQIYYHCGQPAWKEHDPFQYVVRVTRPGVYEVRATVVSVKPTEYLNLVVNHGHTPVAITIPWTNGRWQVTKPIAITLVKGKNILTFDRGRVTGFPARGIFALSIKKFVLAPD
ncbi:MAG: hypothetical protein HKL95_05260 [Phycisphaerae bacterium]|nr:hypothetical protein [Phycisphaerae bacterium]